VEQLQTQCALLQSGQHTYHRLRQQLTLSVHPFALLDNSFKTTAEIKEQLEQLLLKLETLQDTHQLPKATSTLHKFHYSNSGFGNWGQYLWHWVERTLDLSHLDTSLSNWLLGQLLPAVYWQLQLSKTKSRTLTKNLSERPSSCSSSSAQSRLYSYLD
jgi:hypothetical protein